MTSDFENDEIKDSSFPIDLTDDTTSLDMYGVWVKSGPRDVSASKKRGEDSSVTDSISFTDFPEPPVFAQEEAGETPSGSASSESTFDEFMDIANLPELPDFPDMQDESAIPSEVEAETMTESIEFEDIVPITFDESVPQEDLAPAGEAESTPVLPSETPFEITETINLESFNEVPDEVTSVKEAGFDAEPFEEVQFEDISFPSEESETIGEVTDRTRENASPEDVEMLDTFERTESHPEHSETQGLEGDFEEMFESDNKSLDTEASIEEFLEPEIELNKPTETPSLTNESDMELSIEDFMGPQESVKKASAPSEDDLSSFLDDLNVSSSEPPHASDGGDFDLDSLINSVNEAGALGQEKENLFDDNEPLNIDLEFDESFIEDSEKIRATGSAVSESEFFNSEFGVELVDETAGDTAPEGKETGMDFDALFQTAENPAEKKERAIESASGGSSFLEDTSEFDDLLQSLDAAPVPAPVSDKGKSPIPTSKGFNLDVTEEDSMMESITSNVSESSSDEDLSVSLSGIESTVTSNTEELVVEQSIQAIPLQAEAAIPQEHDTLEPEVSIAEVVQEVPSLQPEPISGEVMPDVEEILDITQFKDYNTTESNPDSAISKKASVEETVSLDFDDISAVEKDLSEENPVTGEDTVVTNDKSTELLMIIADELSSIKKEISTLKSEISGFKAGTVTEAPAAQVPGASTDNSGFFSDDDTDETIALTGDELNNILITADFTEEKSDENLSEEPPAHEAPSGDAPSRSEDESLGSIPCEISEPEIPDTLPDTIFDVPGFENVEPIEVSHVNQITDDVSYLEGSNDIEPDLDNVAIEEPELEIIDFEDEKLEEPELTEFNIDLTGMETDFPVEQEIAVSDYPVVEELAVPEETSAPVVEDFVATDTLSEQELAAVGGNVSSSEHAAEENKRPEAVAATATLPVELKDEIKSVLSYMDQLLESLPEEKIEEFARSEHFEVYKKLFEELGIS